MKKLVAVVLASAMVLSMAACGNSGSGTSMTEADADPFGTGVQVTTDPNAMPALELPSVPTITPNPGLSWDDGSGSRAGTAIPVNTDPESFGDLPESFFDRR